MKRFLQLRKVIVQFIKLILKQIHMKEFQEVTLFLKRGVHLKGCMRFANKRLHRNIEWWMATGINCVLLFPKEMRMEKRFKPLRQFVQLVRQSVKN